MDVRLVEDDRGKRFELVTEDGSAAARMTFRRTGDTSIHVDGTFTDPSHRGRGAGRRLFEAMVDWARDHGATVTTSCWFVEMMFDQDPTRRDVRGP